jgi:hypothetical protein
MHGFEKLLVIKTLLPHLSQDRDVVAMFLDEARIAARSTTRTSRRSTTWASRPA